MTTNATPNCPRNPAEENAQEKSNRKEAAEKLDRGPSFDVSPAPAEKQQEVQQRPEDVVDEESMESFPASDPPSHTRSTA